jgi:hypothetical protein
MLLPYTLLRKSLIICSFRATETVRLIGRECNSETLGNRDRHRNSQSPLEIHKILKTDPDSDSDADPEPITIRCRIFMRFRRRKQQGKTIAPRKAIDAKLTISAAAQAAILRVLRVEKNP